MELERRYTIAQLEYRASSSGPGELYGYAAKYQRYSQNLGGFVEQVMPGAFTKSLADKVDVLARYNHDDNALLGRTASSTLRLATDETGLTYSVDLPDTSVGRDLATLAKRGDVYQSSFAFYTLQDEWSLTDNGFPLRSLIQTQLVDVAPVNTPAYLDTSSAVRSLATALAIEDIERVRHMDVAEVRSLLTQPTVIDLAPAPAQVDNHARQARTLRAAQLAAWQHLSA